jgi:hypothetical protein
MERNAFLVENANASHVKEGLAMQLEFPEGRYLFITGYSGMVTGVTEGLISNLATIPTYTEAADDLLQIRDDAERRGIIRKWRGWRMKASSAFDKNELDYISSKLGIGVSKLSYQDLGIAVSAELEKHICGKSCFTDRLVPMWKGKTRYKYSPVDVPVDCWFDETPESLMGFGRYEIRKGKEGGVVLSEGKPVDYDKLIYALPGIDRSFADYAGRLKITYI